MTEAQELGQYILLGIAIVTFCATHIVIYLDKKKRAKNKQQDLVKS